MKYKRLTVYWAIVFISITFVSCDTAVEEKESVSDDTTNALIKTISIPEEFRKGWTEFYLEEGSLVEYSRQISICTFYELQAYRQCK